jgi:flagellar hook-length control protein FliK
MTAKDGMAQAVDVPHIPLPSSATASPSEKMAEKTSAPPTMILLPRVNTPAAATQVDPTQTAVEVATPELSSRAAAGAPAAQGPLVVVVNIPTEQTLQAEAVRREANLVAGYLASSTRTEREGSAAAGVKTNGFDLSGDDKQHNSDSESRTQSATVASEVSFAATVREVQSSGSANSIQSQTINQIIAQAENLPGREMKSVRLRLRPEELGQIDIQLSRDAAGKISAHITAERESARGTLSRSIDQLRETLLRAGLTVDKLQINTGPGLFAGNQQSADARSNAGESTSGVGGLLTGNETEAGNHPRVEDEKLLSLHA